MRILGLLIISFLILFPTRSTYSDDLNKKSSIKEGDVVLTFDNPVSVLKSFEFTGKTFKDKFELNNSQIENDAILDKNSFQNNIEFNNSFISGSLIFTRNQINSNFIIKRLFVDSAVYINGNKFDRSLNIEGMSIIKSYNSFANTYFSRCIFNKVEFKSIVFFFNEKYGNYLSFRNCVFKDSLFFADILLPDTLDFSNIITLHNDIDFTTFRTVSGNKCLINLVRSDLSRIKINTSIFKIWFPEEDSISYELKCSVYENLLNKFKKDGFNDSYKDIDMEFKDLKYNHEGLGFISFINKWWWNYGYNKEWVLLWSVILIIFFSVLTTFVFEKLAKNVYEVEFLNKKTSRKQIVRF